MVVDEMLGVVNEVPVPNETPPVEAAYQLMFPAEDVALKVMVPVPQRAPGVVPVIIGIVGILTVAVAVLGQPPVL